MVGSVAEALVLACPAALSCATVVVAERRIRTRWRDSLNRRLHELRRPLQVLALEAERAEGRPTGERSPHLDFVGVVAGHQILLTDRRLTVSRWPFSNSIMSVAIRRERARIRQARPFMVDRFGLLPQA